MFQLTPLLGAQADSAASQSLLEFDGGIKVLVDLGWDECFEAKDLEALQSHVKSLSFILLTHATTEHLAAFAHCCKHIPSFSQIPVYATLPVISLGRTLVQDLYSSNPLASTVIPQSEIKQTSFLYQDTKSSEELRILLQPPNTAEITQYFSLIHPLKYSQPHQPLASPFSPPLNDLTITAYNAGHSLGGTLWHIQHGMESVVYAVDWNQTKENVYAGAAWLQGTGGAEVIEQLRKPTALVCSARGSERIALAGGKSKRDALLIEAIRSRIAQGATILIPTDSSARALELAYVLEHAWRKEGEDPAAKPALRSCKLYMASRTFGATMQFASSMLEWMDDNIVREFEMEASSTGKQQNKRGNRNDSKQQSSQPDHANGGPLTFRYLKKVQTVRRLEKILGEDGPKVVLASDHSLEWGFAKNVLERIASNESNLVILTDDGPVRASDHTAKQRPLYQLRQWHRESKSETTSSTLLDGSMLDFVHSNGKALTFRSFRRSPLTPRESSIYQQYLANQQQAETYSQIESRAALETSADVVDEESSSSSSDDDESDPERQGRALNSTFKTARFNKAKSEPTKEALGVNVLLRHVGVYDFDVRDRRGRDQIFPIAQRRRRADEFGELIKPEDYLRAEERDDTGAHDLRDDTKTTKQGLGQKRKWQEMQQEAKDSRFSLAAKRKRKTSSNDALIDSGGASDLNGYEPDTESSEESDIDDINAKDAVARLEEESETVDARLSISVIDFAGIHDQRSLTMLIPLIKPKKLALIGGNAKETEVLAEECKRKLRAEYSTDAHEEVRIVFTPKVGQTVDISVDTNAWTVKLSDALSRQLHWQNVRGLGVVTLAGQLARALGETAEGEQKSSKKLKLGEGSADTEIEASDKALTHHASIQPPTLDILPPNVAAAPSSLAQPLHVGDLRLADLRKLLQTSGHTAEFRGEGTLFIDSLVAVRKTGTGKIEIEYGSTNAADSRMPSMEAAFYSVKRKIYDGLAVIAGG